MTRSQLPAGGFSFRHIIPNLVIDGLLPFLTYQLLMMYVPGISQVAALGIGAIFPALHSLIDIARSRQFNIIAAIVLLGIGVSIVAVFIGGDPKLLLVRESFVTGALGLVCLISLLARRPLLFYIGRQFSAGQDPARIAAFDALWQYPAARRTFRILTVVWGVGWVGEFVLRVVMIWTLSIPQVLAITPFVSNGITFGLIAWTLAYVRRGQQQARERASESNTAAAVPSD